MLDDPNFQLIDITPMRLPTDAQRKRVFNELAPGFRGEVDETTLFYDCIRVPGLRSLCLVGPSPRNLASLVDRATYHVGDKRARKVRRFDFKRYTELWLRDPGLQAGNHLTLKDRDGEKFEIPINDTERANFKGLNAAVTKSKDNDLRWVHDWARYHVAVHKLDAVVLFDNGSTTYTPRDVLETLRSVEGLKRAVVVSVPLPFGSPQDDRTMLLQVAVLNIARVRFLASANGVLSCDIDELVRPVPGSTIFDAARRSPLGYLLFRGAWRHLPPDWPGVDEGSSAIAAVPTHAEHTWREADDWTPATKYVVDMRGLLRWSHWDIHGSVRGFLKDRLINDQYSYLHFKQVSTNWKVQRSNASANPLSHCPQTARDLAAITDSSSALKHQ